MGKVVVFPRERVFYFGSYDDFPDIARTPEFDQDFDESKEPVLKLVVVNEED